MCAKYYTNLLYLSHDRVEKDTLSKIDGLDSVGEPRMIVQRMETMHVYECLRTCRSISIQNVQHWHRVTWPMTARTVAEETHPRMNHKTLSYVKFNSSPHLVIKNKIGVN